MKWLRSNFNDNPQIGDWLLAFIKLILIVSLVWFSYQVLIRFEFPSPSDDWTPGDTFPY